MTYLTVIVLLRKTVLSILALGLMPPIKVYRPLVLQVLQTFPQEIALRFISSCEASLSATCMSQLSKATKLRRYCRMPWECFPLPGHIHLTYLFLCNSSLIIYVYIYYLLTYINKMSACVYEQFRLWVCLFS